MDFHLPKWPPKCIKIASNMFFFMFFKVSFWEALLEIFLWISIIFTPPEPLEIVLAPRKKHDFHGFTFSPLFPLREVLWHAFCMDSTCFLEIRNACKNDLEKNTAFLKGSRKWPRKNTVFKRPWGAPRLPLAAEMVILPRQELDFYDFRKIEKTLNLVYF